jgi:ABC-type lipoprotein export system ATPase subunit
MSLVEARDIYRLYGSAVALQGLTLDVRAGELLVVFGPSGSGKSTLLRILAALDRPTAGAVRVAQHDLRTLKGRTLLEYRSRTLGYADQHYARALAPELTARELVGLRLALHGAPWRRRADELLERIGLADRAGAFPHELSGGQQQRVAVAAALAHRPRLFIADEPTGELDAANAAEVYTLIRELAQDAGATTVLVSHDPNASRVADRVVQIRDGRVSAEDDAAVVNRGGWVRVPGLEEGSRVRGAVEIDVARRRAPATEPPPPTGAGVARVTRVGKAYGAQRVFDAVSLDVSAGAVTAVTGRSGSGKSTLLHLLAGLDTPDAGTVEVLGRDVASLDETARARLRRELVGVVTQGGDLVPFLTARETVEAALELRGLATAGAGEALAAVGLGELADQRVSRLSLGERQRVAVARVLAAKPPILVADEPTARLDEENARAVGALFADLARETGTAIVCATHDPALIEHASLQLPLDTLGV